MKKLIKGLHTFQREVFAQKEQFFANLAHGQNPEVLFITCSDSRINPHLMTTTEPGDLFIIRNAGNIVPTYGTGGGEEATIEYAVQVLGVKDIVVGGHTHCGAMAAGHNPKTIEHLPSLTRWVQTHIVPTAALVNKSYQELDNAARINVLMQESVLRQIENLNTYPAIRERVAQGVLSIHAWVYEIESGKVFSYAAPKGQFKDVSKHSP